MRGAMVGGAGALIGVSVVLSLAARRSPRPRMPPDLGPEVAAAVETWPGTTTSAPKPFERRKFPAAAALPLQSNPKMEGEWAGGSVVAEP